MFQTRWLIHNINTDRSRPSSRSDSVHDSYRERSYRNENADRSLRHRSDKDHRNRPREPYNQYAQVSHSYSDCVTITTLHFVFSVNSHTTMTPTARTTSSTNSTNTMRTSAELTRKPMQSGIVNTTNPKGLQLRIMLMTGPRYIRAGVPLMVI